jgi:hypothetical protein
MNYDQNDCPQFSFITPLFSDICRHLKTKVSDVVGCIFEVECSVGGFLILKQIIAIYLIITTLKWCKSSQTVGHHFKFLSLRKPFMLGKNGIKVFDHIFPQ